MPFHPPEAFDLGRIRLRPPDLKDATTSFECGNDPEVARYADWPLGTSVERAMEHIKGARERWDSGVDFRWTIALATDDSAIGAISCSLDRHAAEFGYFIHRRHWNNGYATAAARTIVEWMISQPSIWRISATCDVDNIASVRVLEKAGLSREGTLRRAVIRPNLSPDPRDAYLYARVR